MTKGRELPTNSKVRRRLFSEDEPVKSPWNGEDYLNWVVKREHIARNLNNEVIMKGMKWNFDFEREEPLNGRIRWYRKEDTEEWVGMQESGRFINMRKRDRDPNSATKSVYADERSKVRRLSHNTVMQRREFFNDGRALVMSDVQRVDDNFINSLKEASPPLLCEGIHWNFDYDNGVPLDGPVEWHRSQYHWIGRRPGIDTSIVVYSNNNDRTFNTEKIGGDSSTESDNNMSSELDSSSDFSEDEDERNKHYELSEKKVDKTEGEEMEKGDEIDEKYVIEKEDENVIEVQDALHNVAIENLGVITDDSVMVKDLKKETNELDNNENENIALSTLHDDNFGNLKITENANTDIDEQDFEEKANGMKNKNEITPRSAREEMTVPGSPEKNSESRPRALNKNIKKKLYSQDFN